MASSNIYWTLGNYFIANPRFTFLGNIGFCENGSYSIINPFLRDEGKNYIFYLGITGKAIIMYNNERIRIYEQDLMKGSKLLSIPIEPIVFDKRSVWYLQQYNKGNNIPEDVVQDIIKFGKIILNMYKDTMNAENYDYKKFTSSSFYNPNSYADYDYDSDMDYDFNYYADNSQYKHHHNIEYYKRERKMSISGHFIDGIMIDLCDKNDFFKFVDDTVQSIAKRHIALENKRFYCTKASQH